MTPLFSSRGAISSTWPPLAVVIWPSWASAPADAGPAKFSRPARKSASPRSRVEATRPPTSIRAPAPKTMPFGLIRKTRPFDCSRPSRRDGSWPTTRLRTALLRVCWTKRVSSSGAIEKPCQLMIVPGALVTVSVLPAETTSPGRRPRSPPFGLGGAAAEAAGHGNRQARWAAGRGVGREGGRRGFIGGLSGGGGRSASAGPLVSQLIARTRRRDCRNVAPPGQGAPRRKKRQAQSAVTIARREPLLAASEPWPGSATEAPPGGGKAARACPGSSFASTARAWSRRRKSSAWERREGSLAEPMPLWPPARPRPLPRRRRGDRARPGRRANRAIRARQAAGSGLAAEVALERGERRHRVRVPRHPPTRRRGPPGRAAASENSGRASAPSTLRFIARTRSSKAAVPAWRCDAASPGPAAARRTRASSLRGRVPARVRRARRAPAPPARAAELQVPPGDVADRHVRRLALLPPRGRLEHGGDRSLRGRRPRRCDRGRAAA